MGKIPVPALDVLMLDEIGKDISGTGMDTKVINRSIGAHYNPFPEIPVIHRVYARALSPNSYGNGVGVGLADIIHDRLLAAIDWNPTHINSLTASTPAGIRTPIHFASDRECLEKIAPTVGRTDLSEVTYCRIANTLDLANIQVSENLPHNAEAVSSPFTLEFDSHGDLFPIRVHPCESVANICSHAPDPHHGVK
jgi:hypothetical protein